MSLVDVNGNPLTPARQRWTGNTPNRITTAIAQQGMTSATDLGPGTPLQPHSGYSIRPRANDYPIGVNLATSNREQWGRTSYALIKGIIDAYDVARMCINHKIDEIRSMEPMFLPADGISGNVDDAIDVARVVMAFPDQENPWDAWVNILLENALRYDSTPIYRRRNLDGDIIGFENLDGATIYPYVDENGRRPKPPAPAYFQRIKGLPNVWFTADDISYNRFRPQSDSPYGLAPIESVLLTANTDLRFQWHFLQMFTDGSIPGGFIDLPPDISSPDQVAEWQDYWDSITLGDQTVLHKLIAVPNGTKISETRPKSFDDQFPEYLMSRTAAAFGVVPQDLGLVKDVNRANGETQTDVQFRVNTLPWVRFVEGIVNRFLQHDLHLPVKMNLDTGRDKEDRLAEAQAWKVYVESAFASADEARQELLGLPIDNERPVPRGFVTSRTGFIPLTSVYAVSGAIDAETAAPSEDAPLALQQFNGTPGVMPDKLPGMPEFHRAPVNPDEPTRPELEHPVPGTEVLADPSDAEPVTKTEAASAGGAATAGVTAATGVHGVDLVEDDELVKAELRAFARFRKARTARGVWRDFTFTAVDKIRAHRLNDEARAELRKAAGEVTVAGIMAHAVDTGRVLVIQRSLDPDDPAAGMFEFPGGHIEGGESPFDAAVREWQEETGTLLPAVSVAIGYANMRTWTSGDGHYVGFLVDVPSELPVRGPSQVGNPDDPDGDGCEAILWVDAESLVGNPLTRPELTASMDDVLALLALDSEDDAVPFVDAPLAKSWRDADETKAPQLRYDLKLTDHYQPTVQAALAELIRQIPTGSIVEAHTASMVKAAADDLHTLAEEIQAELAAMQFNTADLEQVIRDIISDGYLAGGHAGMEQIGAHPIALTGATGEAIASVDWGAWQPGDGLAAAKTADGGLAALLDQVNVTVKGITGTALDQVGNKIAAGLAAGDSGDTIASSLLDDVASSSRAEAIAHTETARAVTAATMDVYEFNGVAEWDLITTAGACQLCLDVEANNPHPVGDTTGQPPIHPRCRCAAGPHLSF